MKLKLLVVILSVCFLGACALSTPYKVIYVDYLFNKTNPDQTVVQAIESGYNVVILSFYLSTTGPADLCKAWAALPDTTKQNAVAQVHALGGVVLVSLGGSTDSPYTRNATDLGVEIATWIQVQFLDGVDFDLENLKRGFLAGSMTDVETVQWFSDITTATRNVLGPKGIITHAPQAPYFGPIGNTSVWTNGTGGFTTINKNIGSIIDWYNVQFYNQGYTCYVDYYGLFVSSGSSCEFPFTSVKELVDLGIPLNKIVVGKPVTNTSASSGFVEADSLHSFFLEAYDQFRWNTGLSGWMWNDTTVLTNWVNTIYPPNCGDGFCNRTAGENCTTCPYDCPCPTTSSTTGSSRNVTTTLTGHSTSTSTTGSTGSRTKVCQYATYFYVWAPILIFSWVSFL